MLTLESDLVIAGNRVSTYAAAIPALGAMLALPGCKSSCIVQPITPIQPHQNTNAQTYQTLLVIHPYKLGDRLIIATFSMPRWGCS